MRPKRRYVVAELPSSRATEDVVRSLGQLLGPAADQVRVIQVEDRHVILRCPLHLAAALRPRLNAEWPGLGLVQTIGTSGTLKAARQRFLPVPGHPTPRRRRVRQRRPPGSTHKR